MAQKSAHSGERSIFFGRVDALRVDYPSLDVPRAADNNVMKVTRDCLFIRTAHGSIYGGRNRMSWWAAAMTIFLWLFFSFLFGIYWHDIQGIRSHGRFLAQYIDNWPLTLLPPIGALLLSFWVFILWRRSCPSSSTAKQAL